MTNEECIEHLQRHRLNCKEGSIEAETLDTAIKAMQTVDRIKTACTTLKADDFSEEVCEAINEYLYDTKQEWEEN